MPDSTNRCQVLHRDHGTECGAPASALVSHDARTLTFHVCARHAPDYENAAWSVAYIATRITGYTHAWSGCIGAGFRGGAR